MSITINTIRPDEGAAIYAWVRYNRKLYRGEEGASVLWERQAAALCALRRENVLVKINTIVLPGINDASIGSVAQTVAKLGATVMNCMPLYPVAGAGFESVPEPSALMMNQARAEAGRYMPLMHHCTRCRADAVGILGQPNSSEDDALLRECAKAPLDCSENRTLAAVASREGQLVNQHLGHAERFWIYKKSADGFRFVEHRQAPAAGNGDARWDDIAKLLSDCRVLLVENAGNKPRILLEKSGLKLFGMEGLIGEGLEAVFSRGAATRAFEYRWAPRLRQHVQMRRRRSGCGG